MALTVEFETLEIDTDRRLVAGALRAVEARDRTMDLRTAGTTVAPFCATTALSTVAVKLSPTRLVLVPISRSSRASMIVPLGRVRALTGVSPRATSPPDSIRVCRAHAVSTRPAIITAVAGFRMLTS